MTIAELYEKTGLALRALERLIKKQTRRSGDLHNELEELRDRVSWMEIRLAALEEEK